MNNEKIRFGPFELDPKAGELRRGHRRVRLQERALKMLVALLANPGEVVTREELRMRLWPAKVFVDFDNGLNNAVNKLRAALGDQAGIRRDRRASRLSLHRQPCRNRDAAGAELAGERGDSGDAVPRIDSIAVLPLANLSSDPEQEYFSDGMTDALISQLAGIRSLRVISRQSVMQYKGSATPMPQLARELGVSGIIEGTVQKSADRVRISVQLIHAPTDRHLWAAEYARPRGFVPRSGATTTRSKA